MVASIAFLWLWNYLGFHLIDMRDLVITILWWIITIGLCIAIHIAEKRRRERIRTIFISDGVLYNPEVGVVRLESNDPQAYVDGMRELLDNLNYDPNVSPDASQKRLRFSYIVHSPTTPSRQGVGRRRGSGKRTARFASFQQRPGAFQDPFLPARVASQGAAV